MREIESEGKKDGQRAREIQAQTDRYRQTDKQTETDRARSKTQIEITRCERKLHMDFGA